MLIAWTKETEDRYTATWHGSALLLKYFNRCWRVIVRHLADNHVCLPPNRWHDLVTAKQDIDVKALRALMTTAAPVAHQKPLPVRIIHGSHGGGKANVARFQAAELKAAGVKVEEVHTSANGRHPSRLDKRLQVLRVPVLEVAPAKRPSLRGPKEFRGLRKEVV